MKRLILIFSICFLSYSSPVLAAGHHRCENPLTTCLNTRVIRHVTPFYEEPGALRLTAEALKPILGASVG
jgi:hypothetical protein